MLAAIYLSEYINRRNGGVLVAPWDLHELPDEWLTTYRLLQAQDGRANHKNAMDRLFAAFRQKHGYRNY